jgi:hypothetical protein
MQVSNEPPQLRIAQGFPNSRNDPTRARALSAIEQTIKTFNPKPSLILVLLSNNSTQLYQGLKALCDVRLGVATVCMLNNKVRKERGQDQYFANVALKVNTKLKGVNHRLDPSSTQWLKNTMLVGMDVTHPAPASAKGLPSIAAVVASSDDSFMLYPASMRLQKPDPNRMSKEVSDSLEHCIIHSFLTMHTQEIDEAKDMMVERLLAYQKNMRGLPERIVIFRDGVAEVSICTRYSQVT